MKSYVLGSGPLQNSGASISERETSVSTELYCVVSAAMVAAAKVGANPVNSIIICLNGGVGSIQILARLFAGKEHADLPLTPTQILFAALAIYHASPYENKVGEAYSEYSPMVLYRALVDCEKLLGHRPDSELSQSMCQVCREFAANPEALAELAVAHSSAKDRNSGISRTLN